MAVTLPAVDDSGWLVPTRVPKGKVLLTVAIDSELREAARVAAKREEITLTVFVARALRERLATADTVVRGRDRPRK